MLSKEVFKTVVASTPLISIDFVVRNQENKILVGKRNNRPAQGYWFVPGGRVLKDESLKTAHTRLLDLELGLAQADSTFLGIYQHFYNDNFSGSEFSTHYVVLAYEFVVDYSQLSLPVEQHSEYLWMTQAELLACDEVHKHTKWYFQANKHADYF